MNTTSLCFIAVHLGVVLASASDDPKTGQWTRSPDLPARREYTRAKAWIDAPDGMTYWKRGHHPHRER